MYFLDCASALPLPLDVQMQIAEELARICYADVKRHIEFHGDCVNLIYDIMRDSMARVEVPDIAFGRFVYAVTQRNTVIGACLAILKDKDKYEALKEVAYLWMQRESMEYADFLIGFVSVDESLKYHRRLLMLLCEDTEVEMLLSRIQ